MAEHNAVYIVIREPTSHFDQAAGAGGELWRVTIGPRWIWAEPFAHFKP